MYVICLKADSTLSIYLSPYANMMYHKIGLIWEAQACAPGPDPKIAPAPGINISKWQLSTSEENGAKQGSQIHHHH